MKRREANPHSGKHPSGPAPAGNKRRILYHHRTQAEDAQGIHIYAMVQAFRELGHEVEIVALVQREGESGKEAPNKKWKRCADLAPAWLYELMSLSYNLVGYHRLAQAIQRQRPDLIYERYALNTFCGVWASRRFGIPLVLEVNAPLRHEQEKLGKLMFKRLARFSERWICSKSAHTLVVSSVLRDMLHEQGVPTEQMVVMPNGIAAEKFHPNVSGAAVRVRYGLEDKTVIGFVGWFRKWHGLEMLLEIMHESRWHEQNVRLLLVGEGPAEADLKQYAQANGLQASVIFTGPIARAEVPAHLAAMDIAVQPKAPEYACPMKIFEYLGMGKCIVAPDQPNIREILCDRDNGYLFQPENKESLRTALSELLRDSAKRKRVEARAAQSVFEKGFLWQENAKRTLELIFTNECRAIMPTNLHAQTKKV
ncbi:glycosyltransferase family 4 protein [candidate division KSB1 bacterium]|nr:glycosyltransferase family 4 protein [candidate division KSB1 bacterium]